MKIKIYGSRASVPIFNRNCIKLGGNTVCTMVETGGHRILLDAGSGIKQFYEDVKNSSILKFDILLSHLHVDHIIGFSTFEPILNEKNEIRIFTKSRNDLPLASQIFGIYKPPYWPVKYAELNRAQLVEIDENVPFMMYDDVKVTPFASVHGNDTTIFRIEAEKTVIYLLDYEIGESTDEFYDLACFCKNADLIIIDATYMPEDLPSKRGWGHTSYDICIKLAEACCCEKMIFSHICQDYTDERISSVMETIDGIGIKYFFAFDGMEMEI